MQILGFKKRAESHPVSPDVKPLPSMAVVSVMRSPHLIWFYSFSYFCFVACHLVVIFPRLPDQLWLLIVIAFGVPGVGILYRQQLTNMFIGKLWVEQGIWHLRSNNLAGNYVLAGEICCWPMIVVLPLRHQQTGALTYLTLARNSLSPADNARLRTWLRVCLRPNT
ncbi:hypothetical protein [Cellvibrio sp. KY-GH-1]|uniref:hypothetical protein n=1 Tax=Cellvibrio sp. KY-GH-1 TaxID=2303332 RepID=UPI001243B14F|nr:hypothetical protein [Cellvibrio sp. KY-GH-1]